jgi:ferric-dicitrate binding protein FerR (iron transport regulator)
MPEAATECEALRGLLYARADSERLPGPEERRLDRHLEACEACAAELRRAGEFTSRISGLLQGLRPPEDLGRKVLQRVEADAPRSRLPWGAGALAAATVAGVVLLALAGERPVGTLGAAEGEARVSRHSGGAWRRRPAAREVFAGERLDLAAGARATLVLEAGELRLAGPGSFLIERGEGGEVALRAAGGPGVEAEVRSGPALVLRFGEVRLRAARAGFTAAADGSGGVAVTVRRGSVEASGPGGTRTLEEGPTVSFGSIGGAQEPAPTP